MAYENTSVAVGRSQDSIRQILLRGGARGINFGEAYDEHSKMVGAELRFAKQVGPRPEDLATVRVVIPIAEAPQPKRRGRRSQKTQAVRQEQEMRRSYRALHYWLKSQFEAVAFGLLKFEDVFLSHFEWMVDGRPTTVGELIIPNLSSDHLLPRPGETVVEGQFAEVE